MAARDGGQRGAHALGGLLSDALRWRSADLAPLVEDPRGPVDQRRRL